ncbi:unnamed protein product, partial [Rotaria magnacalcarata]
VDKKNELTVLGNVECFGTENRVENVTTSNMTATVVPIMQFANSDIQVLNVVHEHPAVKSLGNTPVKSSSSSHKKESLIHDDPAAISMLLRSSNEKLYCRRIYCSKQSSCLEYCMFLILTDGDILNSSPIVASAG